MKYSGIFSDRMEHIDKIHWAKAESSSDILWWWITGHMTEESDQNLYAKP